MESFEEGISIFETLMMEYFQDIFVELFMEFYQEFINIFQAPVMKTFQ